MHFSSFFFSFLDYVEIVLKPRVGAWGGRFNQSADFPRGQRKVGRVAGGLALGVGVCSGRGWLGLVLPVRSGPGFQGAWWVWVPARLLLAVWPGAGTSLPWARCPVHVMGVVILASRRCYSW